MKAVLRWSVLCLGLGLAGCRCTAPDLSNEKFACTSSADCLSGKECIAGICQATGSDAGGGGGGANDGGTGAAEVDRKSVV